jgi:hypothetical protein
MQIANPYATGAGGSDFERRVATGLVCSALAGASIPPLASPTTTVWLQAAHLNCGTDDIVLEASENRETQQRVFISVKSAINPTTSDSEFSEVISRAWKDWQTGSTFDRTKDFFLVAAATSRSPRIQLLARLTDIARASADAADFEHRLFRPGYNRLDVRELRPEISGVIEKETQAAPSDDDLWHFLGRFFVSTFDFDQEASQDKARVLGILRLASESRDAAAANSCWNAVFESISLGTAKAKAFTRVQLACALSDNPFRHNLCSICESAARRTAETDGGLTRGSCL